MTRALVLGAGISGCAAARLLERRGVAVEVLQEGESIPTKAFDLAIISPGIRLDHPWVGACRELGFPIKSELSLGVQQLRELGVRLLAITGSKGKSSAVKLLSEMLNIDGARAVPCGNYGLSVSELALKRMTSGVCPRDWAVVEVSSFQLETTDLPATTFAAAAILNLQEDHLDRHGSVAKYHAVKRRLLQMTEHPVGEQEPFPADWTPWVEGSYFEHEPLRRNALAAVALARWVGVGEESIRRAFADFKPLAHRFTTVAEFGGVKYVDDSKATSLAALAVGVGLCSGPVRLIAGGLAKGDDPQPILAHLTGRVKKLYLIGSCAELLERAWKGAIECEICGTMAKAVHRAASEAKAGETVLLSPGAASYDQFKSYEQRGEVFMQLVSQEGLKR